MDKVWVGSFPTPVVPMPEEEVMDLGEGMVTVNQVVEGWD